MTDYYQKYKKYKLKYMCYKKQFGGVKMNWNKNIYTDIKTVSIDSKTAIYGTEPYKWENINETYSGPNNLKITATVGSQDYLWAINKEEYDNSQTIEMKIDATITSKTNKLNFIHFLISSGSKVPNNKQLIENLNEKNQQTYITKHNDTLVALDKKCFPLNIDLNKDQENKEYDIKMYNDAKTNFSNRGVCFFATYDDKPVGYLKISEGVVVTTTEIQTTYTIIKKTDIVDSIPSKRYPFISILCKDQNYNTIRTFLLNKLVEYLKNNTEYKQLYLTAGYSEYQYYYNKCCFDMTNYKVSNTKLIEYYKINMFEIMEKTYTTYECTPNDSVIFYNVFERKIIT